MNIRKWIEMFEKTNQRWRPKLKEKKINNKKNGKNDFFFKKTKIFELQKKKF